MNTEKIPGIQEDSYDFPYHHVPTYKKGFTQSFYWHWGINYVATIEFLIDKLKQEKFQSLADVGCGDGRLTKELRKEFSHVEVEGIDYSEKAIRLAKAMDFEGKYECLDITKNQLKKRYDIALLIEVFEHIQPECGEAFLSAVANLINPGGLLIMTVPHINVPVEPKHYRHFSVETLSQCLEKKFVIEEIIPFEKKDKRKDIIDLLLYNKIFILNSGRIKNLIYKYYKKNLFFVKGEELCKRIYIKARVK